MTILDHVVIAFPQTAMPSEGDIADFLANYDGDGRFIIKSLTVPKDRLMLDYADPDFLFYARSSLLKFMLGSYLLTLVDSQIRTNSEYSLDDYALTLLYKLKGHDSWNEQDFYTYYRDFTIYQCQVIATCLRAAYPTLDSPEQYLAQLALNRFWMRFPPISFG